MGLLMSRTPTTGDPPEDPGESDAALVTRAQQGDVRAFALLYRRHVDRVFAFAARRLADRAAAEEATQEVFARALANLSRCRDDASFTGWLFAITRHVVQEHHRAGRRVTTLLAGAPDPMDPGPTPEERTVRAEAAAELNAARERCLGAGEKELFDLLLADLTHFEIATALGRRPGAVRTAHWRLLTKLRDCLGVEARGKGIRHVAR